MKLLLVFPFLLFWVVSLLGQESVDLDISDNSIFKSILPIECDFKTGTFQSGYVSVNRGSKRFLVDSTGQIIYNDDVRGILSYVGNGLFTVFNGPNRVGVINLKGEEILPDNYYNVERVLDNRFLVEVGPGKSFFQKEITLIDDKGQQLAPQIYDGIKEHRNGLFVTQLNQNYGLIDQNGVEILKPTFQEITILNHKVFIVKQDENFGLINREGVFILPMDSVSLRKVSTKYVYKKEEGIGNLYNYDGQICLSEKGAYFLSDEKKGNIIWNYKKENGINVIEALNEKLEKLVTDGRKNASCQTDMCKVKAENTTYIFDETGILAELEGYDFCNFMVDSLYFFAKGDGKKHILDKNGNIKVDLNEYGDYFHTYTPEYFLIYKNGKRGLINAEGEIILEPIYDDLNRNYIDNVVIYGLTDSQSLVMNYGIINLKTGKKSEPIYSYIDRDEIKNGLAIASKSTKFGLLNNEGKEVLPFVYDKILLEKFGFAWVRKDKKIGLLQLKN